MNKPEISILLPSIRVNNLPALYESILLSTKRTFELIVVGPYSLPTYFDDKKNVKFVRDFGSPSRCSNIAFQLSEGQIITDVADDALYYPNALDESINILYSMGSDYLKGDDYKNVVLHQYLEGKNGTEKIHQNEDYYKINNAQCTKSPFIPDDWLVFNSFVMNRQFVEELGFLDCRFQGTAIAHIEFGIRAQKMGANVKLAPNKITNCDHSQNDHAPIEIAQCGYDEPLYHSIYRNPSWFMNPMCVNVDNWKSSPSVWRRFK